MVISIDQESASFVEQMLDNFSEAKANFRNTILEPEIRRNLKEMYLTLKYIVEKLDKQIVLGNRISDEKLHLAFRRGMLSKKLLFEPLTKFSKLTTNPKFKWQDFESELDIQEYIDLVMMLCASVFEFYYGLLGNGEIFNCTELARKLGRTDLLDKISSTPNLLELYEELASQTSKEYGKSMQTLFELKMYQIRCACFHMSYSYATIPPNNVKIYLTENKDQEIAFDELIRLLKDILAKANIIITVPYFFHKGILPLPEPNKEKTTQ